MRVLLKGKGETEMAKMIICKQLMLNYVNSSIIILKNTDLPLYLQHIIPSGWKIPEPAHHTMGLFF